MNVRLPKANRIGLALAASLATLWTARIFAGGGSEQKAVPGPSASYPTTVV